MSDSETAGGEWNYLVRFRNYFVGFRNYFPVFRNNYSVVFRNYLVDFRNYFVGFRNYGFIFRNPFHGWSRAALGLLEVACRVTDTSDVEPGALQFFFSVDSLQLRRIFSLFAASPYQKFLSQLQVIFNPPQTPLKTAPHPPQSITYKCIPQLHSFTCPRVFVTVPRFRIQLPVFEYNSVSSFQFPNTSVTLQA